MPLQALLTVKSAVFDVVFLWGSGGLSVSLWCSLVFSFTMPPCGLGPGPCLQGTFPHSSRCMEQAPSKGHETQFQNEASFAKLPRQGTGASCRAWLVTRGHLYRPWRTLRASCGDSSPGTSAKRFSSLCFINAMAMGTIVKKLRRAEKREG